MDLRESLDPKKAVGGFTRIVFIHPRKRKEKLREDWPCNQPCLESLVWPYLHLLFRTGDVNNTLTQFIQTSFWLTRK